jgi:hypothetical protein
LCCYGIDREPVNQYDPVAFHHPVGKIGIMIPMNAFTGFIADHTHPIQNGIFRVQTSLKSVSAPSDDAPVRPGEVSGLMVLLGFRFIPGIFMDDL